MIKRIRSFGTGVLLGASLGAVAMILSTPRSGRELRQRLHEIMQESAQAAEESRQALRQQLADKTTATEDQAE